MGRVYPCGIAKTGSLLVCAGERARVSIIALLYELFDYPSPVLISGGGHLLTSFLVVLQKNKSRNVDVSTEQGFSSGIATSVFRCGDTAFLFCVSALIPCALQLSTLFGAGCE